MIPLIFGAAALASAAVGALAGAAGMEDMKQAKEVGERAQELYENALNERQTVSQVTNGMAEEYGQLLLNVRWHTVGRFVVFVERLGQQSFKNDLRFLEKMDISVQQFQECKAVAMEAEPFFNGSVAAAMAGAVRGGAVVGQSLVGLVGLFGTASTGTAISGLSGAAAWNATLAWLGGGSLAAGGGGMALGSLVLGGITVGPALAIGGFMLANKAEKALTQALEYEEQVKTAVDTIVDELNFLEQVQQHIIRLSNLIHDLNNGAVLGLNELESRQFNQERDTSKLQQVQLLVNALTKILKTPVLDNRGNLNPAATTLLSQEFTIWLEEELKKIQEAEQRRQEEAARKQREAEQRRQKEIVRKQREAEQRRQKEIAQKQQEAEQRQQENQIAKRTGKALLAVLIILGGIGATIWFKSSQESQITIRALSKNTPLLDFRQSGMQTSEQASTNLIAAQKLGLEAAEMVQNPPHPLTVWQQAQAKWQEAINLLEAIPSGTSVSAQSKEKLAAYRANYAAISNRLIIEQNASVNLENAQKLAMEASIIVQYPPYPAEVWQQAQAKWQQAINLLEAIPEGTFVSAQAKEKLVVYRNNYAAASQRAF
jgi:hypothetical protein